MKSLLAIFATLILLSGCGTAPGQAGSDGTVYMEQADHDLRFGDANKAVASYTEAIRIFTAARSPKLGEAYFGRGMAYSRLVRNAEAERDFQEAARLGYAGNRP